MSLVNQNHHTKKLCCTCSFKCQILTIYTFSNFLHLFLSQLIHFCCFFLLTRLVCFKDVQPWCSTLLIPILNIQTLLIFWWDQVTLNLVLSPPLLLFKRIRATSYQSSFRLKLGNRVPQLNHDVPCNTVGGSSIA